MSKIILEVELAEGTLPEEAAELLEFMQATLRMEYAEEGFGIVSVTGRVSPGVIEETFPAPSGEGEKTPAPRRPRLIGGTWV